MVFHRLSVGKHALYRGGAGLLGAAEGFVLQGGDASFFVARRRILINALAVGGEIVFEIVDQLHGLPEQRLILAAVHEKGFRAEHFRNLGEDGGAALADEQIGKAAHRGIRRDAGQAVGAAAFHADHKLAAGDGLPLRFPGVFRQEMEETDAFLDLILTVLGVQEADAFGVIFADIVLQDFDIAVFTAKAENQDAARVGMMDQIGQDFSGIFLILAHLGAAVGVGEGYDGVDASRGQVPGAAGDGCGHIIHTAHGWNDPELVAHARLSVRTAVALEKGFLCGSDSRVRGVISIGKNAVQRCFQVMGVHMGALRDVFCGDADGFSVFDHGSSPGDIPESEFMSGGDVFVQKKAAVLCAGCGPVIIRRRDPCIAGQRLERYGDSILRVDSDTGLFHLVTSLVLLKTGFFLCKCLQLNYTSFLTKSTVLLTFFSF